MATILSATFLFALDNTIVADVQAVVVEDLGEVNKLSWLAVAFVLASSSTIVTWYHCSAMHSSGSDNDFENIGASCMECSV